ncbi:MAG: tetratricopeptide repeat protein [Sphingobacteriaceae bacterium]|nr:MAG: tetratricopeptide repeat protein [Sphingobacteriaceae bacterium]
MKKKQIGVVVIIVAMMTYLISLPVKGLIRPKEERTRPGATGGAMQHEEQPTNQIDEDYVAIAAKKLLTPQMAAEITDKELQLKSAASDQEKLTIAKDLARTWDDVNVPAPAAFYYLSIARKENTAENWLSAGNHFNDAYKLTQDTVAKPAFLINAVESFKKAMQLAPTNLDAQTGLGIAYVNGGAPSPMAGISLLLGVVKKEPKNLKANLNLGLFSMKSGQFEKAVDRFKNVVEQKPELEPYFYLAESYKQLGMKPEAIEAYQKCKGLAGDPAFNQKMDEYITELKK